MIPVTCASGVELLMDYLEGVLSPAVRAALDEHVGGCERCAAFVASYCETPRIFREATASMLPAEIEASLKVFLRERTTAFKRQ
jgi:anti-sigma factor RsiW